MTAHVQQHISLPDDLHVFLGSMDGNYSAEDLDRNELAEYRQLKNKKRCKEFLASRMMLKTFWQKLDDSNTPIAIQKNSFGKPYGMSGPQKVFLSLAHSNHSMLAGISKKRELGVDLEPVRRKVDERLRARIYHPKERPNIKALPLIRLWTIKEALVKLYGGGLRTNLVDVHVREQSEETFSAKFDNDMSAIICSFRQQEHWLAVAYYA